MEKKINSLLFKTIKVHIIFCSLPKETKSGSSLAFVFFEHASCVQNALFLRGIEEINNW